MAARSARPARLLFVAGETSGDHHAAAVIRALGRRAECYGLGGPAMAAAGMRLDLDLASRSVIGFAEVLRHLPYFRRAMRLAEGLLQRERPQLLVLVDYPGFNLRLAARARELGVPVAYYVSPQVWAWKRGRLALMRRLLRKMLLTFPFEAPLYAAAGVDHAYVGNPLLDAIPAALRLRGARLRSPAELRRLRAPFPWRGGQPLVGLLPGSREQEVRGLLPVMLRAARLLAAADPARRFAVLKPPAAPAAWYAALQGPLAAGLRLHLYSPPEQARGYAARAGFDAALVASGTATLETALLGTPFCILYKVHPLTYFIGKRLVKIHSIGLANVVAGRRVVPEFLQGGLEPAAIAAAAEALLGDRSAARAQRLGLAPGLRGLGSGGVARRVAAELLELAAERR